MSQATVDKLFAQYDADGSGTLSKEDFQSFFQKLVTAGKASGDFDSWFTSIDEDGSGTISKEDLLKYVESIGYSD